MNNKLKAAVILAVAIVAALTVWTVTTVPDVPKQDPKTDADTPAIMTYANNTIHEEDANGNTIWDVTAEVMEVDTKTQSTVMRNTTAHYHMQDGNVLTLTAPKGEYDGITKDVKLSGGVRANTTDGANLRSEGLTWDAKRGRIIATGKAYIVRGELVVEGDVVEAWDGFKEFKATGNARVEKKGK